MLMMSLATFGTQGFSYDRYLLKKGLSIPSRVKFLCGNDCGQTDKDSETSIHPTQLCWQGGLLISNTVIGLIFVGHQIL